MNELHACPPTYLPIYPSTHLLTQPFTSLPTFPPKDAPAYPHAHGHAAKRLARAQNSTRNLRTCTPAHPHTHSHAAKRLARAQNSTCNLRTCTPAHPHNYPCLLPCRETKRSKGIAYVLFQIPEDAVRAHAELDMTTFQVSPTLPSPRARTPGSPALFRLVGSRWLMCAVS